MDQVTRVPGSIVDDDEYLSRRKGLGSRIWSSWVNMRAATRELIEENPQEQRLVFFVLLSDIIFFLSASLRAAVSPIAGMPEEMPLTIGLVLIGSLFLRTAAMYAFSLLLTVAARIAGGKGSWKDTRTGVFWAALVAAPFGLLMALIAIMLQVFAPDMPIVSDAWFGALLQILGLLPLVWFVSLGLAEAQGFASTKTAFQVLLLFAIIAIVVAGVMWLTGF
ncbi:MAG: YIP1 family protein [Pseudomonadota bacterium]